MGIIKLVQTVVKGRQLRCEACGEEFLCGPLVGGCWCAKIDVPDEARRQLKQQYSDCLCPACLGEASGKSK